MNRNISGSWRKSWPRKRPIEIRVRLEITILYNQKVRIIWSKIVKKQLIYQTK